MNAPDIRTVPIEAIVPYENNPRSIPQSAIELVARSLSLYGWQQPIVVDKDMVIVVGHTRRQAALSLGMTEVPIMIADLPADKIREYRLVDNRTAEFSGWDYEALVMELREFEQSLLDDFFPEVDLEVEQAAEAGRVTEDELKWAQQKVEKVTQPQSEALHTTTVECPSCYSHFEVRTRTLPGMNDKVLEEIASGTSS